MVYFSFFFRFDLSGKHSNGATHEESEDKRRAQVDFPPKAYIHYGIMVSNHQSNASFLI